MIDPAHRRTQYEVMMTGLLHIFSKTGTRTVWRGPGFLILAFFLSAPVSWAGDFGDGLAAFKRGDHAAALRLWKPLADQGDRAAQYNLGLLYELGKGVPAYPAAARSWYEKSAAQNFAMAQHNLGRLYYMGEGVPEDYTKAIRYFLPAAEQGIAFSHFFLGMIYAGGGGGVQPDHVQAYKRLSLAAALHGAADYRGDAISTRKILAKGMTPEKIVVAERLARLWLDAYEKRKLPVN